MPDDREETSSGKDKALELLGRAALKAGKKHQDPGLEALGRRLIERGTPAPDKPPTK